MKRKKQRVSAKKQIRRLEFQVAKIQQIYQEMSVQLEYSDFLVERLGNENSESKDYAAIKASNKSMHYWQKRIYDEIFKESRR